MPTKPYSELRKKLTPEQRKRSAAKLEAMKIGMLVREQREKAGLSQTELGDQIGISQQRISKIEFGDEIELSTLQKIFAVFGGQVVLHLPDGDIPLPMTPTATEATASYPS